MVRLRTLYRLLDVIGYCTCVLAIAKKQCEMPSFFSYAAEVLTDLLVVCETKISKKKTQKLLDKKMTSRENIFLMLVSEKLYIKSSMYI